MANRRYYFLLFNILLHNKIKKLLENSYWRIASSTDTYNTIDKQPWDLLFSQIYNDSLAAFLFIYRLLLLSLKKPKQKITSIRINLEKQRLEKNKPNNPIHYIAVIYIN